MAERRGMQEDPRRFLELRRWSRETERPRKLEFVGSGAGDKRSAQKENSRDVEGLHIEYAAEY